MKRILKGLAVISVATVCAFGAAAAEGEGHSAAEPTHFPIFKPHQEKWSFAGPFGKYDLAQLQRGL